MTFNLTYFIVVFLLQLLVEIKKHRIQIEETKAEETATAAKQNMDNAKLQLTLQESLEIEEQNCVNPRQAHGIVRVEVLKDEVSNMNSSSNALKFARAFSFFAILPASIYSLIYSLENIENWRPHGTTAFNMILLGIGVPCYLFIHNIKMGEFALKYLKHKTRSEQKISCIEILTFALLIFPNIVIILN